MLLPDDARGNQWLSRPELLSALAVVVTLGLATALAYQAATAASSHRAAVEATLSHHAYTAAWRFAREARGWVSWGMNESANSLERVISRAPSPPGPAVIPVVLAEKYCDCMSAGFGRTF